jgi:hypothetical protein
VRHNWTRTTKVETRDRDSKRLVVVGSQTKSCLRSQLVRLHGFCPVCIVEVVARANSGSPSVFQARVVYEPQVYGLRSGWERHNPSEVGIVVIELETNKHNLGRNRDTTTLGIMYSLLTILLHIVVWQILNTGCTGELYSWFDAS